MAAAPFRDGREDEGRAVLNLRTDFAPPGEPRRGDERHRPARPRRRPPDRPRARPRPRTSALRLIAERLRAERDVDPGRERPRCGRGPGRRPDPGAHRPPDPRCRAASTAIADAVEKIGALPDPVGRQLAAFERPNGLLIERVAVAARRHRRHLREPAQRHGRCRRALPQGRQRRDPARRLRQPPHRHGHRRAPCAPGSTRPGLPADADPARADPRPRRRRRRCSPGLDGCIDVIVPRGGRGLVERVQAEARVPVFAHLDGICHVYVAAGGRPRHGAHRRAQQQDAPHRHLRRRRDAAGRPRLRRRPISRPSSRALLEAGCAVRGDAAVQAVDRPRRRRPPRPIGAPSISTRSSRCGWSTGSTRRSRISRPTARTTPTRSSPTTRPRPTRFLAEVDSAIVAPQRLDPVRRWRRVRLRRRDRHRDRPHACARPGRRRAADLLQVPRPRHRPDPSVMPSDCAIRPRCALRVGLRTCRRRRAGHADRPLWRLLQSGPCRPPPCRLVALRRLGSTGSGGW